MFLAEKKVRLLDEAADRIKSYIEDHQLQPGMRLPSERDLVKQLSLGRTSIREGLRYLEMLGLIEIQAGKGIYLKDHKESSLNKTINSWFTVHEGTVRELIELREAIETHSAFLAAMRASARDIIEMEQAVSIMRVAAEQNDVARFVEADTNFHDAIARASGNSLLRRVLGSIAQEIITFRMAAAYFGAEMLQRSLTDHTQILKAIVAREPSQALQAMREHIVRTPMDFNLLDGLNDR